MKKKNGKQTKTNIYLATDGKGMVLNLQTEGKWLVASCPFDPELITQGRTIDEAFAMAYDAKKLLEECRAEAARSRPSAAANRAPRGRKATAPAKTRSPRRSKPAEART